MSEPVRALVMQAIAAQLQTIRLGSVEYGGGVATVEYYSTPSVVTRSLKWITQYDKAISEEGQSQLDLGPVFGVVRGSGSEIQRVLNNPRAPGAYDLNQIITIWGYVKATADRLAGDVLDDVIEDHLAALFVDPALWLHPLGPRNTLPVEPFGPLDTDDGVLEPLAYFAQNWRIVT